MQKLQSLLLIEHDESVKKGIALRLMDYFEEIQITSNLQEAIEILEQHKFTLIIIESDLLKKFDNTNAFFEMIKTSWLFIIGLSTTDNHSEYLKIANYKVFDKPVNLKSIENAIIILRNKEE